MHRIWTASLAAVAVGGALSLTAAGGASANPSSDIVAGAPAATLAPAVYTTGDRVMLEQAQYIWGGRNYCWYDGGWHGPGWYWCGYAWRDGFGWGGPHGWRGWYYGGGRHDHDWHDHGWHGGGWHDHGGGWHGDHGDGHGDWHGGGHHH